MNNNQSTSITSKRLYQVGAAAAMIAAIAFRRNMEAEYFLMRQIGVFKTGPSLVPESIADWFALLQSNPLLGLTMLNIFDLINYALVGLFFLALVMVLWKSNRSLISMGAICTITAVCTYFNSNQALSMHSLSEQFTAAGTFEEQRVLLSAGKALLTIYQNNSYAGAGIYISFLLISMAGLLFAIVMLHSGDTFTKSNAWMGILANGFGLSYYLFHVLAPQIEFMPLSISAVFLLIWYIQIGLKLFALSRIAI